MKKQIALCALVVTLALPTQAQYLLTRQEHAGLNNKLERTVLIKNKIQATLTITVPITKQYFKNKSDVLEDFSNYAAYRERRNVATYQSTVGCKAFALDDHWLIAGAGCLWNGRHPIHVDGQTYYTGLVEEDFSKDLVIHNTKIPTKGNLFVQPRFTLLPHFLLVRVPQNSELAHVVKSMPKINILSTLFSNPLHFKEGLFYVNTSRFGRDSAQLRKLAAYDAKNKTVTIQEKLGDLATLANDPLLYVLQENVYWIGINDGIMAAYPDRKWDGKPSKNFVTFNNVDLDFIERTITEQDPTAWQRIARRLHKDTVK